MKLLVKNISKHIGKKEILKDISIELESGKVYGFVGKNGSGKTMLFRALSGLMDISSGKIFLDNKELHKDMRVLENVGIVIENAGLYPELTGFNNLKMLSKLNKKIDDEQIRKTIVRVGLNPNDKRSFKKYSLGMKQRLAIARAILARPEFLILDEPINALDPEGIREMRNLFQRLNREDGTTIFISSHILSEVDLLADTIGIIQHGKLLTELPIEEIHKHQTDYISLQVDDVTRAAALLQNMRIKDFSVLDKEFIHIYDSDISGRALSKAIIENGIGLESIGRKQDTLEDFFFQLTEEEK